MKMVLKDQSGLKKAYDEGLLGQGVALEAKDALEAFKSGRAATTILFSPGTAASHASRIQLQILA